MSSPSTPDPLTGQLISGRYRVIRVLGEGGMGKVYMAEHEAIEKRIALKVLHREYSANPDVIERFKQEAISASRIKHPNVIDVFDFGQLDDGSCFIAMEFLEGQDLGDALARVGAFDPSQAIRIVAQICKALGTAHARGVVHRDMKPENVFLQNTPEGEQVVKIVDFGIAQLRKGDEHDAPDAGRRRLTKTGMIFGTPEYMAPEQARGQAVDQRSDIYATGVILYEMVTGSVPFMGQSFLEVLNHHVLTPPPPFEQINPEVRVSPELARVVMKALEKGPDDRFATMRDFAEALFRTPEGIHASRLGSWIGGSGEGAVTGAPGTPTLGGQAVSGSTLGGSTGSNPSIGSGASASAGAPRGSRTEVHGSARVATPVAGSRTLDEIPLEPPKSSMLPWAVGGTFAVVLALGAFLAFGRGGADPERPEKDAATPPGASSASSAPSSVAEANPPAASAAPSSAPSAAPPEPPDDARKVVTLHVTTDPPGALVEKSGFQVCDASPCDVTVQPGEGVELRAKLGSKTGTAKVLAARDQTVAIQLAAAAQKPRPAAPSGPQLCEVEVDGLKILRPCK